MTAGLDTQEAVKTVFDAIVASLAKAADYNRNDMVAPVAVLWTDKERQWEPLAPRLRAVLPQFLTLGDYDPAQKTGPAIWLRCMIARSLPEADWPQAAVPILYLPGVSRQELRAVDECPERLRPLAELQYRGVFWTQLNAKDWTLLAFLQSPEGGLGLDVARDRATLEAIGRAIEKLADTPIAELEGRRLEASDFNDLTTEDPVREVLTWLNDPEGTRQRWSNNEWQSFRAVCRQEFDFDPEKDGELAAGEVLGRRDGEWGAVWKRFAEAPARYPRIPDLLRRAMPAKDGGLFDDRSSWPQNNDAAEDQLRAALLDLRSKSPAEARNRLATLEKQHAERRHWVWAELGKAPLAKAMHALSELARLAQTALGGAAPADVARAYVESGWQVDSAAIEAMSAVTRQADREAIAAALHSLYRPWLESAAEHFQEAVKRKLLPGRGSEAFAPLAVEAGCCVLFADGLRFDVGRKLLQALQEHRLAVTEDWRWTALPAVTPTAKPARSPVADLLAGTDAGEDFKPTILADGKSLTIDRFRQLLDQRGFQVLGRSDTGVPSGKAWTEHGQIDEFGHGHGVELARRLRDEVQGLVDRVLALIEAGWREVRVITDHGWLLLPGGLPKCDMPAYLAETRWGRCAMLKSTSRTDISTVPWHWNEHVAAAVAPGISCFKAGLEYAHGSLSPQECIVPEFIVRRETKAAGTTISEIKWVGLRCRVTVAGAGQHVDIRTRAADKKSSLVNGGKPVSADGMASLPVEDDNLLRTAAFIVVLDSAGKVLAQQSCTIGGEE